MGLKSESSPIRTGFKFWQQLMSDRPLTAVEFARQEGVDNRYVGRALVLTFFCRTSPSDSSLDGIRRTGQRSGYYIGVRYLSHGPSSTRFLLDELVQRNQAFVTELLSNLFLVVHVRIKILCRNFP